MEYLVYVLLFENKVVYIGHTNNIQKRIKAHLKIKTFDSYCTVHKSITKKEACFIEMVLVKFYHSFVDEKIQNIRGRRYDYLGEKEIKFI